MTKSSFIYASISLIFTAYTLLAKPHTDTHDLGKFLRVYSGFIIPFPTVGGLEQVADKEFEATSSAKPVLGS